MLSIALPSSATVVGNLARTGDDSLPAAHLNLASHDSNSTAQSAKLASEPGDISLKIRRRNDLDYGTLLPAISQNSDTFAGFPPVVTFPDDAALNFPLSSFGPENLNTSSTGTPSYPWIPTYTAASSEGTGASLNTPGASDGGWKMDDIPGLFSASRHHHSDEQLDGTDASPAPEPRIVSLLVLAVFFMTAAIMKRRKGQA